jgi:integrase
VLPFFENMRLLDIEPIHVRRWQNTLITQGYSETYLKTINNQLNAVLNYATRYYKLPNNPAKLCGSMGKKDADKMEFWTREEFLNFREKIKDKEMSEVIFDLFFYAGMREGELLALTLEDFDFESRKVSINKSYSRRKGKDLIQAPKTPKSKRIITIPNFLCKEIEEFAKKRYDYRNDERLFPVTKYYLHHEMNRGSKLSGVKRIRIHDLRHSHVALLIEMNVPILLISERLGHDNPETTLRIYGHLYPNRHEEVALKLNLLEEKIEENEGVVRF